MNWCAPRFYEVPLNIKQALCKTVTLHVLQFIGEQEYKFSWVRSRIHIKLDSRLRHREEKNHFRYGGGDEGNFDDPDELKRCANLHKRRRCHRIIERREETEKNVR
ncbi:hypothetical protein Trydic_g9051 [Trypoxylus dichotomus]